MPDFPQTERPVSQYGIRRHGVVHSIQQATITLGALAIALSLPDVSVSTGTNQTVAVSNQAVTLSPPTVVRFLPPMILDGGNQTIVLRLPDVALSIGAATPTADSQVLALTVPDVGVAGTAVSIPVPYRRPVSQYGIWRYGPPSPTTSPETTFNQSVGVDPVVVALSPPDAARTATVTLGTSPHTVALSVPTASVAPPPTPGVSGHIVTLLYRQRVRARFTPRPSRVLPHGVIEELAPEPQTQTVSGLVVALSVPTAVRVPGAVTKTIAPNAVALSMGTATVGGGPGFVSAGSLSLVLSLPDVTRTVSGTTVALTPCVVTLSAPALQVNRFVALTTPTVALSVPTAVINQAAVRSAGTQTIALALPAVTVAVTAQTRAAGEQILRLSVPNVLREAIMTRQAPAVGLGLSVPSVSVITGVATVPLTSAVLALQVRTPSVIGATSLPADLFEGTVESRLPEHRLVSRMPERTLELNA